MRFLRWHVKPFRGCAFYWDPNRNPLLAVQHGPGGWLVMTGSKVLLRPKFPHV